MPIREKWHEHFGIWKFALSKFGLMTIIFGSVLRTDVKCRRR